MATPAQVRTTGPGASLALALSGLGTPLIVILLLLNTLVTQPGRAFAGLGLVALGAPAFYFWRSRSRRAPATEPVL
jgi:hypothetical protein